jgi:hypothetical protein
MAKHKMSDLEIDIRKLGKYTRFIAAISFIAVILGVLAGTIMVLTAYGPMSSVIVPAGLAMIFVSLMVYWVNQYFVYMGRGMTYLMNEILDKTGHANTADPQDQKPDS